MNIDPDRFYRVTCVGDYNDGDYDTRIEKIKGQEIIDHILPVVEKIRAFHKTNENKRYWGWTWADSEYSSCPSPKEMYGLTDDEYQWWIECIIPSGDQGHGIHRIEYLRAVEWVEEIKIL